MTKKNVIKNNAIESKLEKKLLELCLKHKITIGAAESCTAGALAVRITQEAGASQYFMGSIVSYTNLVKTRVLGIPGNILEQYGAISIPVALLMLEGAILQLCCDVAISITGIAGPSGGSQETPVGTVFIAIGGKKVNPEVVELHLKGDRQAIIQQSVEKAMELLINCVEKL